MEIGVNNFNSQEP